MNYKFLKQTFDGEEINNTIYAISNDRIEDLRFAEIYENHGQQIGTYVAGDWIKLLTKKAVNVANKLAEENDLNYEFSLNDIVYAHGDEDIFDDLELKLIHECADEDYDLEFTKCKGFDYFDGSNWNTVIIEVENDVCEPKFELIEDEELEKELNHAIENKEWVKDGFGRKEYKYNLFKIIETQYPSDFSAYQIEEL